MLSKYKTHRIEPMYSYSYKTYWQMNFVCTYANCLLFAESKAVYSEMQSMMENASLCGVCVYVRCLS